MNNPIKDFTIHKPIFILDLDGVLTDGRFYYTAEGKVMKSFGPDDNDALQVLAKYMDILVVTADSKGFEISKRRVENDMGLRLVNVDARARAKWIQSNYESFYKIYMGDGIFDPEVFAVVELSIAPSNASANTQSAADFVTKQSGGDRAVAEACQYILQRLFNITL